MHAIVHGADIQDRDGGVLLMATLFGAFPFLLKLYADGGYQGAEFQAAAQRTMAQVNVEIVNDPTASEGSSFYRSAGLLRGISHGSTAVADWRKTGSVSAERPSHSYGSPQSGSCCESYASKHNISGQTLRRDLAEKAVGVIADHFGVSVEEAAAGIYRVVNASMAAAIRQMTVEKGVDPREFALVPFGGAAAACVGARGRGRYPRNHRADHAQRLFRFWHGQRANRRSHARAAS